MNLTHMRRIACGLVCMGIAAVAEAGGDGQPPAAFQELLQQSLEQKSGLMFYVKGEAIPGVVTAISADGAVEARNQERDRIVIRLDRVDAIAK